MNILDAPLRAASAFYGALTRARNFLYDSRILPSFTCGLPLICVGNISAGGNSKTPLCIFLAKALKAAGREPVILSRGYKGSLHGPHLVAAADRAAEVGDEPLMLALFHDLKVVIAKDRAAGAEYIRRKAIGSTVILDDGFQHRRLGRDLDIVTIDVSSAQAVDNFISGRLVPAGRLRENRDTALKRAQVAVLSARQPQESAPPVPPQFRALLPGQLEVFRSFVRPAGICRISDGAQLAGCEGSAFCAIAGPQGFFQTLRAMGIRLSAAKAFPDHYVFKSGDLERLRKESGGKPLICTEKDAVKLPAGCMDVYVLKMALAVDREQEFIDLVLRHCSTGRAR